MRRSFALPLAFIPRAFNTFFKVEYKFRHGPSHHLFPARKVEPHRFFFAHGGRRPRAQYMIVKCTNIIKSEKRPTMVTADFTRSRQELENEFSIKKIL